jgi:hypothetical protein
MNRLTLFALIASLAFCCSCVSTDSKPDRAILHDRDLFSKMIRENRARGLSADFLRKTADSSTVDCSVRQMSVLQLFGRHVHVGMTIDDLSKILDDPIWLKAEDITLVKTRVGISMAPSADNQLVSIRVLPSCSDLPAAEILLSICRPIEDSMQMFNYLKGIKQDVKIGGLAIREIVSFEVSQDRKLAVMNGFGIEKFGSDWELVIRIWEEEGSWKLRMN